MNIIKILKGLIIGYTKGLFHDLNNEGHMTVMYWSKDYKNRKSISCCRCDKVHFSFDKLDQSQSLIKTNRGR